MFTGFATENTPAIQVWDFSYSYASSTAIRSIALADDCSPIQYFKTGGSTTNIRVYLPSAPVEGRQIKIINNTFGALNAQKINIYSSDITDGSSALVVIGPGQTIDFCYSRYFASPSTGTNSSGWITLSQSPLGAYNSGSAFLGGSNNSSNQTNNALVGGNGNTTTQGNCAAVGGTGNNVNGSNSAVVSGYSNTASGAQSAVVAGNGNTASGSDSAVVGGISNSVSGNGSNAFGGFQANVSGVYAAVIAANQATANSNSSIVLGGSSGTTRSIQGNVIFSASSNPVQQLSGAQQLGFLLLGKQTTDATSTVLCTTAGAGTTTNQLILPNNSAYYVRGSVIANVTGGGDTSSWTFQGAIKRGANAASTTLVAAITPTLVAQDSGAATWTVAVTANTTTGGLAVTVTGAAATTIRWVCKIETTEVTF